MPPRLASGGIFFAIMNSPASSGPARWTIRGRRQLLKTRIFEVEGVRYHHPVRDTEREFVVINPPDWVNVVAITPEGHLVLVKQFRYGTNAFSLEIPGGVMEEGEDPLVAGARELREETGYASPMAGLLGSVHPNPAIQSNRSHFILVEQARPVDKIEWDVDEEMEIVTMPVDDVYALARAGGITHGLVLDALFFFEPRWRQIWGRDI